MDLGLLNYIDVDLKWNIVKKGHRSMTRRPRKPGVDSFRLGNNPSAFEAKKAADVLGGHFEEKVVDAPLKKRRLLRQSLSPSPQTPCLHGEGHLSPEPQTPSVHHEDSGQLSHSNSLSLTRKTKSKSGSRSSKNILKRSKKEVSNLDDFSGIELLAAAACSSFLQDNADHVEDFSVLKERTTPGVDLCTDDMKETAGSSNRDSMVPDTPILHDNGNEEGQKKVNPSKGLRLHWDLNTVMDEWEEPCLEGLYNGGLKGEHLNLEEGCEERFTEVEPSSHQLSEKHDVVLSVMPAIDKNNESIEDLMGTKKITSKISDGESSASKSDVVDSLVHSDKCEDLSTSTTSVLREETIVKCESDTIDNHKNTISESDKQLASEEVMQDGFPSPKICISYSDNKVGSDECCGSDVTQDEQGHMAEGDTTDKVQIGYDSPFEDGELREEPIGWEENEVSEKETVNYESDNTYKNDYGTIENVFSEKIEVKVMEDKRSSLVKEAVNNTDIKQGPQADNIESKETSGRKTTMDSESKPLRGNSLHIDESTSIDGCRNGAYIRRSRSSNIVDPYSRSGRDLGPSIDSSMRIHDYNRPRNSNLDPTSRSDDYNRPRNSNLDPTSRSGGCRSLDGHQFRNYDPRVGGYGLPRGPPPPPPPPPPVRSLSRDRYRGGSGFHPQGPRRAPEEEYNERKTRVFSPNFNRPGRRSRSRSRSGSPPIAWHFQKRRNLDTDDKKPSNDLAMIRRNQRIESIGYPERLKSDHDHFRFTQRSGRFSPHKYKDNGDSVKKYDGSHYEKTRRFRYMADRNLDRGEMVIGESKSEEKGRSSISRFS